MSFDEIITGFAQRNGMDALEFRDSKYHLVLDDTVELMCFQNHGLCYFHGVLGLLPDKKTEQEEMLAKLLKTNLSLINVQRASLCIEPDNKHLGLYLTRPLQQLSDEELESTLLDFLCCYEILKQDTELNTRSFISGSMMMP